MPKAAPIEIKIGWQAVDADRLNQKYAGRNADDVLRSVLKDGCVGRPVIISSFGTESAALLHMAATVDPAVPVLFLDTGKHFPETLQYLEVLRALLKLENLHVVRPDEELLARKDEKGLRWSYDPDICCHLRKVLPLESALQGYDASITGRKAFQAGTRAELNFFEADERVTKVNPFAHWTKKDVEEYFRANDLPRHPLEKEGYLSIGCAPCTSKVRPDEDPRSGRWRGFDKTECGIHEMVRRNKGEPQ